MNIILNIVKNTLNEEKSSKFEYLHQRITEVEEKHSENLDQTNKKFLIVKENVLTYIYLILFYLFLAGENSKTNRR